MQWIENEQLFKNELAIGYGWQLCVADYLKSLGFEVHIPQLVVRKDIKDIPEFSDEPDIECEGRIIEVKSRDLAFTCPDDFPYETILVDTVNGWSAKVRKPTEYVCISTITGGMICLCGETQPLWAQEERYDHTRNIMDLFYEAHKSLWITMDHLISQMKAYSKR